MVKFKELSAYATPEQSPGFLLWHVSTSWRSCIEGVLKPLGLTHPQFVVLAAIGWLTKDDVRIAQASVGKMAGLDPNTLSQVIRGLENKSLVTRIPSNDGRVKNPLLTPLGAQLLTQALPAVEAEDARFFCSLKAKERAKMMTIFKELYPNNLKNRNF